MNLNEAINILFREYSALLALSFIILFLSLLMMQIAIRLFNFRNLTIPAIFYFTYLVMIFLPSFWVFAEKTAPYRDTFMFAVLSALITLPLGIVAANFVLRFKPREIKAHFNLPLQEDKPTTHVFTTHLIFVIVAIGFAVLYFVQVGSTPLSYLIHNPGYSQELTLLREQSFKLLDPRWATAASTNLFYVYLFLRTLIFPFLILTTFGYYLYSRQKKWLLLFGGTLGVGGLYAASSLARAPVAALFMRLFFFYYLFKQKLNKRLLIVFAILIISFPLAITTFAYGKDTTLTAGLARIGRRFTYTPASDLYYYFEIFPDYHEYVGGQTLIKPFLQIIGTEYFYIENYVHRYISPNAPESGHANAAFLSNLHADFGLPGVLMGGFFLGFFIQILQIYISRQKKTIYNGVLYAFFIYAIWALNFGSITSVLFVNGVLPVLLLPPLFKTATSLLRQAASKTIT